LAPAPPAASVAYVTGTTLIPSNASQYFVAALNTADGTERWRYTSAYSIRDVTAVGDAVVFWDDALPGTKPQMDLIVALNASDGSVRWTYATTIPSQFTAQDNAVYIATTTISETYSSPGSSTGYPLVMSTTITSLDVHTSAVRWRKTVAGETGQPIVVGSSLYDYLTYTATTTSASTSGLVALDSDTGKQQWLYSEGHLLEMPAGRTGPSGPLVVGNLVYTLATFPQGPQGMYLDDLVALDAQSGSVRWRSTIGGKLIGLSADDAMICFSATLRSPSGGYQSPPWEVEALRAEDGQTLWRTPLAYLPSAPILGDNQVFLTTGAGASTAKTPVDLALALGAANGKALWRVPGTLAFLSGDAPTTDGALVYLTAYRNSSQVSSAAPFPANTLVSLMKAVSAADGQPRWETPLGVLNYPAFPIVANGKLFVILSGGGQSDLAVLDPARGNNLWTFGGLPDEVASFALPA
jgi:hypothetical protein